MTMSLVVRVVVDSIEGMSAFERIKVVGMSVSASSSTIVFF